jgi:putative sporulation protein YtaF
MPVLHLLSILLLSVSTNLDNFGVGFAYGIRHVCVSFRINLLIAFVNATGTLISMLVGERLYYLMRPEIANYIGSSLLIIAGSWFVIRDIAKRARNRSVSIELPANGDPLYSQAKSLTRIVTFSKPSIIGMYCSGHINPREGMLLAVALTFSNLVTGVGAALIGLDIIITATLVFVFGVMALSAGLNLGGYAGRRWLQGIADPLGGLLLIIIGLYEMAFQRISAGAL